MNSNDPKNINIANSLMNDITSQSIEMQMLENRKIFISEAISSVSARKFVSYLLTLDVKDSGKEIEIYLNSPGGEVNSGFSIYDTIKFIKSPVKIINTGLCASIATIINISVPKERRFSMPNSRFLIHQPLISGQIRGQASDIEITAQQILITREKINKLLAEETGTSLDKVSQDTVRDYWMNAGEALDYGLIGKIITDYAEI